MEILELKYATAETETKQMGWTAELRGKKKELENLKKKIELIQSE